MKLVNVKNRVKTNLVTLAGVIKYYFYAPKRFFCAKYFALYELLVYRLLATTTVMVRQLIIRQGKNPDYVPPPPVLPQAPILDEVFTVKSKTRPQLNIPYVPSWVRTSFKSISAHPTYKSRIELNLQPNALPVPPVVEPIQVALAPEVTLPVVEENIGITTLNPAPFEGELSVDDAGDLLGFIKYGDKE